MSVTMNIQTQTNADFSLALRYLAGSEPVDLTGSVLRMMVRHAPPAVGAMISIDSAALGGIDIEDAANGLFNILLPRDALSRMTAGSYAYDIVRARPDGLIEPVLAGAITHTVGVTR
ncbi:MAG: hypothetical protein AB7U62_03035 [Pseudolabrys sp.]